MTLKNGTNNQKDIKSLPKTNTFYFLFNLIK